MNSLSRLNAWIACVRASTGCAVVLSSRLPREMTAAERDDAAVVSDWLEESGKLKLATIIREELAAIQAKPVPSRELPVELL